MKKRHAALGLALFGAMILAAAACTETGGGGPSPARITIYSAGTTTTADSVMIEPAMDSVMIEPSRVKCYTVTTTAPDTTTTTKFICKIA